MKILLAFLLAVTLGTWGCVSITKPESVRQQIAYGYANLAAARDSATQLLTRKAITVEQAKAYQGQFDTARASLDAATVASGAGDLGKAEDQLKLALSILTALEAQLKAREGK